MAVCRNSTSLNTCQSKARSSSSDATGIRSSSRAVLFNINKNSVRSMSRCVFEDNSDNSHKTVTRYSRNGRDSPRSDRMMCEDDENISQVGQPSKVFRSLSPSKVSQDQESDSSASSYEFRQCKGEHPSPDTTTVESRDSKRVRSVAVRVSHGSSSDGDSAGQKRAGTVKSAMDCKGNGHDCVNSRKRKTKKRGSPDSCKIRYKRESETTRKPFKRRSSSSERTMPRSSRSESPYRSREPSRSQSGHHHARCQGGRRTSWHNYKREYNAERRDVRVGCRSTVGHKFTDATHMNGAVSLTQPMMQTPIIACHHCNNSVAMSSCLCASQRLVEKSFHSFLSRQ